MESVCLLDYVIHKPELCEPNLTKVVNLTVTGRPQEKYGFDVEKTSWNLVKQGRVLFSLSNGHWAYSHQILIEESKLANVLMKETTIEDLPMYLGRGCDMIIENRLKAGV